MQRVLSPPLKLIRLASFVFFTGYLSFSFIPGGTVAAEPFSLPVQDRHAIEKGLGKDVLGEPLSIPTIDRPGDYLKLVPNSRTYRILAGPHRGREEVFRFFPMKQESGGETWHYDLVGEEVGFLRAESDGTFVITGILDSSEGVLTRYSPPEPVILRGLGEGETRKVRMEVRVFDLNRPNDMLHEGWLDVVYQYLGAFRVKVPAGTFDAVLIKSTFNGEIGPAALNDTQYRFFARDTGIVATVERRDVSAFLIYRPHSEVAMVLSTKPN